MNGMNREGFKMRKNELIKRINEFYEYLHLMSHHKEINISLRKFYDLFKSVLDWDWDLKTEEGRNGA